ncbi:MAG: ATP-dependent Clp protease ATP-binding subunit [Planctomycetes bacterium]|nr:ATP-dependent Clp protease ATP-binding subunit [Planctomycetota bacterium]
MTIAIHWPGVESPLTNRAQRVLQLAAGNVAARFNHEEFGTEHILLALMKDGSGRGVAVLTNLGIDLRRLWLDVEASIEAFPGMYNRTSADPTPGAERAVRYSIDESQALKHDYVGTEHLLLGLFREQEGIASRVLRTAGLTLDLLRAAVQEIVAKRM